MTPLRLPGSGQPRIDAPIHIRAGRRLLILALVGLGRGVLRRYGPTIVAVTGSVGKTTTTALVAAVVSRGFTVRSTPGNWNGEVGVPATILGAPGAPADTTVRARLRTLADGIRLLIGRRPYPDVLVLEIGAGRPGELERITRAIRPDVAVVTNVRPVHLEHFGSVDAIAAEKAWVVKRLRPGGAVVLPADDKHASRFGELAPARVFLHDLDDAADLWLEDVRSQPSGSGGTLCVREESGDVQRYPFTTRLLGRHQLRGVLSAVGAGVALGIAPEQALEAVASVETPDARLRPLSVRNGLTVLDDSYNASAQAVSDALDVLAEYPPPRIAVLGDMRELGPVTESSHRWIGELVPGRVDALVTVGEHAALIADSAIDHGFDAASVHRCTDALEATQTLAAAELGSATVLVKGSKVVGLDAVVTCLVEPGDPLGSGAPLTEATR
jgi:UDP-N-acetylmuramoyl-tripeptide--D-alanyl-D-alanine ligase